MKLAVFLDAVWAPLGIGEGSFFPYLYKYPILANLSFSLLQPPSNVFVLVAFFFFFLTITGSELSPLTAETDSTLATVPFAALQVFSAAGFLPSPFDALQFPEAAAAPLR